MCLSIWSKSPKIYEELKQSNVLILPSGRLLSLYKNSVQQNAGFNEEVLDWMVVEMRKLNLDAFGKESGIIWMRWQFKYVKLLAVIMRLTFLWCQLNLRLVVIFCKYQLTVKC